jgi:hypothetical protein
MNKFLIIAMVFMLAAPQSSLAAIEVGEGSAPVGAPAPPPPSGGGVCDWSAIKDSLYGTESAGSGGYNAVGPNTKYGKPLGKYQFIPPTQESMLNKNPQCKGQNCHGSAIMNTACHPVQECLMDALLAENQDRIKKNKDCQALLGRSIRGCRYTSRGEECLECSGTESGLLAAYHLGGADSCSNVLGGSNNGNGDFDGGAPFKGTSEAYYMCKHGGKAVPGNCTPPDYDYSVPPPTLTYQQLQVLEGQGDEGFINTGATIKGWWVGGLMIMAEQFTANMMVQVQSIGKMLDAKHQLETQRLFQEKIAEAHKDYHPSEQMCTFGTFARDLASTERHANLTRSALSKEVLQRELGSGDGKGMTNATDTLSRLKKFIGTFCDPMDNSEGLKNLCKTPNQDAGMFNRDIDYTRTLDEPLSLDIDMTDDEVTSDEEAVFALIDNLFAHKPMQRIGETALEQRKFQYYYHNQRSIIAMRGIARNSFSNLIALKTATPEQEKSTGPYLKALMKELGLDDEEVEKILGENPSYFAQMDFLTRKIYQNPAFYTNLYDKPVNVERIRAAMRAIKLMNDRDIQSAMHRREMLLSMMLELRLREQASDVYNATEKALFNED